MSEHTFQLIVRRWLHDTYFPRGVWWPNTTGYGDSHHPPFGGPGAADLIGLLDGRWVEIELKTQSGVWSPLQQQRKQLVERAGGVYILLRCSEGWQSVLQNQLCK